MNSHQFKQYISLVRLNKPIGILLLLWPTLWALWLAGNGHPDIYVVIIFTLGVILMRSAGCIINDIADRHVDAHVTRTAQRPLATKKISTHAALILFAALCLCAFLLVLLLNRYTILLAFAGLALAIGYPFLKRVTHLPQLGLGLAFAWGIPMAFAAIQNTIPASAWILFLAAAIWPVIYDTMYAMVDQADDVNIGIKSTAILFGKQTVPILGFLQLVFLALMSWVGILFNLPWPYFLSLFFGLLLFGYQLSLIKDHQREKCFRAFLNNHWVGMVVFVGILF